MRMRKKFNRILVLEDNLADAAFLREALDELEEIRNGDTWLSPFEICDAESLDEALVLLGEISFDAILADLWLPDSSGIATFQHLKAAAPSTPILAMLNAEDPSMTVRLMQEGAQDVLVKHEVDCTPLGRAIRCAMERSRISSGLRRMSIRDELTGLLNFTGFHQLGDPYCRLLGRSSAPRHDLTCGMFQVSNLAAVAELNGRHEEEWLLVELAEMLKVSSREFDLVANFGGGRFVLLAPDKTRSKLLSGFDAIARQITAKATARGMVVELQIQTSAIDFSDSTGWQFDAILDLAEQGLWENKPFEQPCENEAQTLIQ